MLGFKKSVILGQALVLLSLLSACSKGFEKEAIQADPETTSFIINGKNVDAKTPAVRSTVLFFNAMTKEVCTATLLATNYALTAAHCLDSKNSDDLYVLFGTEREELFDQRQVIASKASPYWANRQREDKDTGDIAVIKFDGGELPEGYGPAEFLQETYLLRNGANILVLGYGVNDPVTTAGAGTLRSTNLPILNSTYSGSEMLLDQSKGSRICHGDSGGPAYIKAYDKKTKTEKYYLWGIANRGIGDDDNTCENAVAYTNATLYWVWIQNVLKTL